MKKILLETPKPCIIMGDFNAHHILFGCHSNNNRGNCLYKLIDEFDMCVLNDGSATTVPYPNRNPSAIDLALVSPTLAPHCEWRVHDDAMGSYHYPTQVVVNVKPSIYEVRPVDEKYIYSKADWSKYYYLSETCFSELNINNTEPLNLYNNFVNILYQIQSESVPKQKPTQTPKVMRKPAPWWNQTCDDVVQKSKQALVQYRKSPSITNFINYKKLDAQKKRTLKEERVNSWHDLCSTFNRMTPISRIWAYIRRFKRIGSSHNRYLNDEWVPSFLDKISNSSQFNMKNLEDILNQSDENQNDLLLYSENQNLDLAVHNMNTALNQLQFYYRNTLKLEISSEKSKVLVFSKDPFAQSAINIIYDNNSIPIDSHHKFLGVIIDDKLKFDKHINHICQNAMKSINVMRSLAGTFWGSDPKTLNMLYKSIVRSHFDYSSMAYMNASCTLLKKLDVIQNMGLRVISGAMRTTPINTMEIENCIPPLSLRRLQLAERFCLKELSCENNVVLDRVIHPPEITQSAEIPRITANTLISGMLPEIPTIMTHTKNLTRNMYTCNKWPIYKCPYNILLSYLNIKCHLDSVKNKFDFLEFLNEKHDYYILYTDGSKGEHVKAAYYDPQMKSTNCYKIPDICSIFTAESWAILEALKYVYSNVNNVNILIVSDSKSVLTTLCNSNLKYKQNFIVYRVKEMIVKLGKNVEFVWVPSHIGITGNEIVDQATRCDHDEDLTESFKVPFTDYYHLFKMSSKRIWKEYWDITTETKGKWYAELQQNLPTAPWYYGFRYTNRKFITCINRMRSGHCLVPAHLNRMKIIADDKCTYCLKENADKTRYI
ncbi:hypothetical protein MSG28_008678 [Choristoneura fumiferana]|uniref:Uncharacterized protein n=1 Tax=Choristoneura fumiferana TaxID=7141 RepID=A0ACC0J7L3_CHOFU|nr:hypothetical protein MSG28_008678 [Choristoneura fumiferana]